MASTSLSGAQRRGWFSGCRAVLGTLALSAVAAFALDGTQAIVFGPGDTVRVSMAEDPEVAYEGAISAIGTIPLPYLREFRIAGMTREAAEQAISEALCKDLYQKATVSIALLAKLPVPPEPPKPPGKVYAYGAITKPGVVLLPEQGQITAMQLVSEIGGLTSWAAPQKAYIIRQEVGAETAEKIPVDLTVVFSGEAPKTVVPFRDGDVFFVPGQTAAAGQLMTNDECQVIIVGEVNAPGIIRFASGEQRTMMRAIFKAAGFTKFAKDKGVRLIRYSGDGARSEQVINVSEIIDGGFLEKDVELQPGDMIIVPQKAINF
ncbi:MAG: hypothetical protein GX595_08200 [Lentisphaerae bacterium]|nr:hypothetical protein [Lentisphaerota bacterium]